MHSLRRSLKQVHKEQKDQGTLADNKNYYLLAGLRLLNMAKDVSDTFKPYKSEMHLWRDIYQPFRGLNNCWEGFKMLVLKFPLRLLTQLFGLHIHDHSAGEYLAYGLALLLRGFTQVVTTPLSWLRILMRGAYTSIKGWQRFEKNHSVQELVKLGESLLKNEKLTEDEVATTIAIIKRLIEKREKAILRTQSHSGKTDLLETLFSKLKDSNETEKVNDSPADQDENLESKESVAEEENNLSRVQKNDDLPSSDEDREFNAQTNIETIINNLTSAQILQSARSLTPEKKALILEIYSYFKPS